MNTVLVDYGIQQEKSDLRAHVSVAGQCVYAYSTKAGLATLSKGTYRKAPAFTGGIRTAEGYLVPPSRISGCRCLPIPDRIFSQAGFRSDDTTTEKGNKAVRVVRWLLRSGLFPLWAEPKIIEESDLQVEGTDILIKLRARIQVKCDWRAGTGPGCSGYLFLQVTECNPFNRY